MFGYSAAEMLGQSLTMLMPARLRERHEASFARYLATGRKHLDWQAVELVACHKDGRELPVEISFGEVAPEGRAHLHGGGAGHHGAQARGSGAGQPVSRGRADADLRRPSRPLRGHRDHAARAHGGEELPGRAPRPRLRSAQLHLPGGGGDPAALSRQLADEWTERILQSGEPFLAPTEPGGAGANAGELAGCAPASRERRSWERWWSGLGPKPRPTASRRRRSWSSSRARSWPPCSVSVWRRS